MSDARAIIDRLKLEPHPEGGWYKEVWRSPRHVSVDGKERSAVTSIYYLLEKGEFSAFHRVDADEVWHLYSGGPVELLLMHPETGKVEKRRLGLDVAIGEEPQVIVPAGWWQGARLAAASGYALCGCTVGPGFEFDGFELGKRSDLVKRYPQARGVIEALTRE